MARNLNMPMDTTLSGMDSLARHWHTVADSSRGRFDVATSLIILGAGYTARVLFHPASHHYNPVLATSRDPDRHLNHLPSDHRILFDLAKPSTWKHIPPESDVIWCFPAVPLEFVKQFSTALLQPPRRLVVLASTSAYTVGSSPDYPPPWIDETYPLDFRKPRVQGEEYLRSQCGAIVLRVAGIYGPGRNPLDWLRAGKVGPSRKYVNLIHVEDLALICLLALERGIPGEAYNVSDGTPRTWDNICEIAQRRWSVTPLVQKQNQEAGKRISNAKLTNGLNYKVRYSDLSEAMEIIEPQRRS